MNQAEFREKIKGDIDRIKSAKEIYDLFKKLNYPKKILHDISAKRKKETFDFKKEEKDKIKEIYTILSFKDELSVFLIESKTLYPSFVRYITKVYDEQYPHFLLIFTVDYNEIIFVFPTREKIEAGKHKLKITKLVINKKEIHYTDVETLSNIYYNGEETWRDVWKKWKKAFSVERVTDEFFEDYITKFFALRNALIKQMTPRKEAHEFTLQFLNRIMFIYFISKKNWLEHPKFMGWLWNSYKKLGKYGSNEFYRIWLKSVFFRAFNNRSSEIKDLPKEVIEVLSKAPYLNGGLFSENDLDNLNLFVGDQMLNLIFDFFEKYNFTIKEDMPLDQEVAVDPQMLGYVYESLANVAEEIYDRNDLGIFYTPRVEVDFMCRRSLVEYLLKNLPEISKEKFYHLIFDLPEDKEKIEAYFEKEKLWYQLKEVLDNLSVVDPACGSGAFLVGMLNVLAELYRAINRYLKKGINDFNLKFGIVQRSLYGVDVMPWAIHAAELRLWLQLIVETEFKKEELRKNPLLPNLNLNLRIGDSLVQEIGGLSFNIRTNDLKSFLKKKLDKLKDEKRKYFENSPTAEFKTPEEVRQEEIRLFEEIIEDRIESLETDITTLNNSLKQKSSKQIGLFGAARLEIQTDLKQKKDKAKIEENIKKCEEEIEKLKKIKELLHDPEKKPFVWDIDFAEIFGDKNGFDIVIGNPPYVRQEMISPPNRIKSEVNLGDRRGYKEKLIKSVQNRFSVVEKIDKKSDYYIYFYFHGLSLLNGKGTFCFITSNSWLDVGYGQDLQEFLLKYVPIIAIYDNPKRSFAHADVNTIIALFGPPKFQEERVEGFKVEGATDWPLLNNIAKFVMFKKPFEEVLSSQNLIEIGNTKVKTKGEGITELVKNVVATQDYRCFPMIQEDLLEDGWEYPENYKNGRFKAGSYEGNKWGGKYLRAPDIFYTILEKGKGKLVRLGDIAKVRFGIKTGANEFFYLPNDFFTLEKKGHYFKLIPKQENLSKDIKIEKEFLRDVIFSLKEIKTIFPSNLNKFNQKIFICNINKSELKNTSAKDYIEFGEQQKFNKIETCKQRKVWYSLGDWKISELIIPSKIGERFLVYSNETGLLEDKKQYGLIRIKDISLINLLGSLNTTIYRLYVECTSRQLTGAQAIADIDVQVFKDSLLTLGNFKIKQIPRREIKPIFEELGINPDKPIREQEPKPLPDRAELDKIIFDELGLTKEERKEVYWAVCELVKQRLEKARSLRE